MVKQRVLELQLQPKPNRPMVLGARGRWKTNDGFQRFMKFDGWRIQDVSAQINESFGPFSTINGGTPLDVARKASLKVDSTRISE